MSVRVDLEGDKEIVNTGSESTGTESESESEHDSAAQSPLSGSVHYFIAPLDSSKAQDMMIEELNQVRFLTYFLHMTIVICMQRVWRTRLIQNTLVSIWRKLSKHMENLIMIIVLVQEHRKLEVYLFVSFYWTQTCPVGIGMNGTHRSLTPHPNVGET